MLTDTACRKAKREAPEYKLADSGGLYLRVTPTGSKTWCWKYRVCGREKKLTIGRCPATPPVDARRPKCPQPEAGL